MTASVKIVEVGPRDGLQNETRRVDTADKIELIDRLALAGLRHIEAASFVSPRRVPQMSDHSEVMTGLHKRADVSYCVLTPNLQGLEAALRAGAREVAVFAAASEGFSQRNINCSVAESIQRFEPVLKAAEQNGIPVRGYVSCVVACPYDGPVDPEQAASVAERLVQLGCYEISLGDTIGTATPAQVLTLLDAVHPRVPLTLLAGHFHDTYGMAAANVYAAFQAGVRVFDSAIAGLGGCPYAAGASGNLATEDLVYLMQGLGVHTGVDLDAAIDTALWISDRLETAPRSRVTLARQRRQQSSQGQAA